MCLKKTSIFLYTWALDRMLSLSPLNEYCYCEPCLNIILKDPCYTFSRSLANYYQVEKVRDSLSGITTIIFSINQLSQLDSPNPQDTCILTHMHSPLFSDRFCVIFVFLCFVYRAVTCLCFSLGLTFDCCNMTYCLLGPARGFSFDDAG